MFSVFSNNNQKMSEKIKHLQNVAGQDFTRLLFEGPEDEPLYMLTPGVINILKWVNCKILFELPKAKYNAQSHWIGVRIRIATNMLNKQVDAGVISKQVAITYHERLTSRIRKILSEIYTEDLPFLG